MHVVVNTVHFFVEGKENWWWCFYLQPLRGYENLAVIVFPCLSTMFNYNLFGYNSGQLAWELI